MSKAFDFEAFVAANKDKPVVTPTVEKVLKPQTGITLSTPAETKPTTSIVNNETLRLELGNCLDGLKKLADNSIDAVVTDPPYGLSFMGKKWDYDVPSTEIWSEVLRVLKPGGHLLSFGGTRTYHRLAVNIEDAGFEIRDQIQWLYGSGFPKSTDVSKRIDKESGAERKVIGKRDRYLDGKDRNNLGAKGNMLGNNSNGVADITAPATDSAKQWQGWGTALKPANEPIVVARKPLEKGLTVAENVQKWGTGAINIDGTRIGTETRTNAPASSLGNAKTMDGGAANPEQQANTVQGRWPANIILDETAAELLDAQSGVSKSVDSIRKNKASDSIGTFKTNDRQTSGHADSGGASRFFYVAKASKRERNAGCEDMGVKQKQGARPKSADASGKVPDHDHRESGGNNHPTVKPIKLMEYLIKLVTPPNGTVLDPFMGSGSTGVAAVKLKNKFVGCEMSEEYIAIAKARITHTQTTESTLDETEENDEE